MISKELVRNPNGFSATLWKWFYNTSTLPKSYCNYFWSNIVAGIFGLPLFIMYFPTKVLCYYFEADFVKDKGFWAFEVGKDESWGMRFVLSLAFWLISFLVVIYFYGLAALIGGFNDSAANAFIIISIILVMVGIGIVFGKILQSDTIERQKESIQVAASSFMDKHCPKITWTNDGGDK